MEHSNNYPWDLDYDYIEHWGIAAGGKAKNHKYYMRINNPHPTKKSKYLYFYTKAQYDAYLKTGKVPDQNGKSDTTETTSTNPLDAVTQGFQNVADLVLSTGKQAVSSINGTSGNTESVANTSGKMQSIVSTNKYQRAAAAVLNALDNVKNLVLDKVDSDNDGKIFNDKHDDSKYVTDSNGNKVKLTRQNQKKINNGEITLKDDSKKSEAKTNSKSKSDSQKDSKSKSKTSETKDDSDNTTEPKDHKYLAKIKTANGWRYFYDQESLNAYYAAHPEAMPAGAEDLPLKDESETPEEDMEDVNPSYNPWDEDGGYENNCYDCTLAYEARRRGFDVEAIPDDDGATIDEINTLYNTTYDDWASTTSNQYRSSDDEAKAVSDYITQNYGEGSRGQLCVYWSGGGGHSMVWEVVDNKVVVRDCQDNRTYPLSTLLSHTTECDILRTDDKEISETAYNKYLKASDDTNNRTGKKDSDTTTTEKELIELAKDYTQADMSNDYTESAKLYEEIMEKLYS